MNYTHYDVEIAKKLLNSCKDDLCFQVPVGITQKDIDRLHNLKLFDASLRKPIIALCSMETLERIDQDIREKRAHDDDEQAAAIAKKRADKKEAFRHDVKVAAVSAIIIFCLDHIDDIYGLIKKLLGLLSQWIGTFQK